MILCDLVIADFRCRNVRKYPVGSSLESCNLLMLRCYYTTVWQTLAVYLSVKYCLKTYKYWFVITCVQTYIYTYPSALPEF